MVYRMQTATASQQTGPDQTDRTVFVPFDVPAWRDPDRTAAKARLLEQEEMADRAARENEPIVEPEPIAEMSRRRWFGLRAAKQTTPQPTRTAPPSSSTAVRGPKPKRASFGYRIEEVIGYVAPLAALVVAGYYQAETAHDVLGWPWPVAWVLSAAIEGAAARAAILLERHLIAGDSTMALRLGMLIYAGASSLLIGWHADATGKPWEIGVALGFMTLSAIWLWGRNGRWKRREDMRAKGLIDSALPRFSAARWVLCPWETPAALRYAVKHSISEPDRALDEYRKHRSETKQAKADRQSVATPDRRWFGLRRTTVAQGPVQEQTSSADRSADQQPTAAPDQTPQTDSPAEPVVEQTSPPAPRATAPKGTATSASGPKRRPAAAESQSAGEHRPRSRVAIALEKSARSRAANVRSIDGARYGIELDAVRTAMREQKITELPPQSTRQIEFVQAAVIKHTDSDTCGRAKAIKVRDLFIATTSQGRDDALAN